MWVWNATTGALITRFLTRGGPVASVAFSPDGRRILTASGHYRLTGGRPGGEARVWDASTGKPVGPPLRHSSRVLYASFSPTVTASSPAVPDLTARVWDAATGRPLTRPLRHDRPVHMCRSARTSTWTITCGSTACTRVVSRAVGADDDVAGQQ